MKEKVELNPKSVRNIIQAFSKELADDSKLDKLSADSFNTSSVISKWVIRKKEILFYILETEEKLESRKHTIKEQIIETSNEILPDNVLNKKLRKEPEIKNLEATIKLLNIAIEFVEEAKEVIKTKGFQSKNLLEYLRWTQGVID